MKRKDYLQMSDKYKIRDNEKAFFKTPIDKDNDKLPNVIED